MNGKIFIGLGSNIGDRLGNLEDAYKLIEQSVGQILRKSSVYVSPPWGFEAEIDFYNSVIEIESCHEPTTVIAVLKEIERKMGRIKSNTSNYESRIIDLDILDYRGIIKKESGLELPHSKMHLRRFVLTPLQEICTNWQHPISKQHITQLIQDLGNKDFIAKLADAND